MYSTGKNELFLVQEISMKFSYTFKASVILVGGAAFPSIGYALSIHNRYTTENKTLSSQDRITIIMSIFQQMNTFAEKIIQTQKPKDSVRNHKLCYLLSEKHNFPKEK